MSGFQFKQFYIEHSQCAMKVGTDSIMLGSWADPGDAESILDIGTGSGLLAIMLAQKSRHDAHILGVDVSESAVLQARFNARQCPWHKQLHFLQSPIQQLSIGRTMDVIISNPPYFQPKKGRLHEGDPQYMVSDRRVARHTTELNDDELMSNTRRLLSEHGHFFCVLPADRLTPLQDIARTYGLYCRDRLAVKSAPDTKVIRYLLRFGREPGSCRERHIAIRTKDGNYSGDYKALCKDFYLNF